MATRCKNVSEIEQPGQRQTKLGQYRLKQEYLERIGYGHEHHERRPLKVSLSFLTNLDYLPKKHDIQPGRQPIANITNPASRRIGKLNRKGKKELGGIEET